MQNVCFLMTRHFVFNSKVITALFCVSENLGPVFHLIFFLTEQTLDPLTSSPTCACLLSRKIAREARSTYSGLMSVLSLFLNGAEMSFSRFLASFRIFVELVSFCNIEQLEPRCEKTGLQSSRPGLTQTGLHTYRRWLEA